MPPERAIPIAAGHIGTGSGLRILWRELRVAVMLAAMLFAFAWAL